MAIPIRIATGALATFLLLLAPLALHCEAADPHPASQHDREKTANGAALCTSTAALTDAGAESAPRSQPLADLQAVSTAGAAHAAAPQSAPTRAKPQPGPACAGTLLELGVLLRV